MWEIFAGSAQLRTAERAAIEGVLADLRPALAIEIGSAEGHTLRRIAAFAGEVHSFDLLEPEPPVPANATLHTGDSHRLLPQFLAELGGAGRNVDFALVDGDHTAEGVRRDVEALLDSSAVQRTVVLVHDVGNEEVREGFDAVRFADWPKVHYVEPDWIPGVLFTETSGAHGLWGGLGLVLVDADRGPALGDTPYQDRYQPSEALVGDLRERLEEAEAEVERLRRSVSWRSTAPLRHVRRLMRQVGR
jgi:hypothetical protein